MSQQTSTKSHKNTTTLTNRLMGGSKNLKIKDLNDLPSLRNHSSGQVCTDDREARLLLMMQTSLCPYTSKKLLQLQMTVKHIASDATPLPFGLPLLELYSSRTLPFSMFLLKFWKNLIF